MRQLNVRGVITVLMSADLRWLSLRSSGRLRELVEEMTAELPFTQGHQRYAFMQSQRGALAKNRA